MDFKTSDDDIKTEFTVEELTASLDIDAIGRCLATLISDEIAIISTGGTFLCGNAEFNGIQKIPITLDFEPIAWLICNNESKGQAAAQLLRVLFTNRARYQMAANMHKTVSLLDFNALQNRNQELQIANHRIQALVDSLEDKVQEQVAVIETNQRKLYEHAKLSAVGQLAAGMAHEINNPIGFITSNFNAQSRYLNKIQDFFSRNLELLTGPVLEDFRESNICRALENINVTISESLDGCVRIRDIVKDLRVFANIDQGEWDSIDLVVIIESVCHIIRGRYRNASCITLQIAPLPFIHGQPGFLAEALFSLVSNALEAVSGQQYGHVNIQSSQDDEWLYIQVEDNGPGIAPELKDKIFEPFFTTKAVGEGTGLGLSTCRDIVSAHKGKLQVENRSGGGTCVRISLPLKANVP